MITLTVADQGRGRTRMHSDEFALQGYCAKCKRVFEVRWAENLCPDCEEVVDTSHLDGLTSAE